MFFSIGYTRYETDHIPLRLLILGIDYLQDPVSRPYGMPIWQCLHRGTKTSGICALVMQMPAFSGYSGHSYSILTAM